MRHAPPLKERLRIFHARYGPYVVGYIATGSVVLANVLAFRFAAITWHVDGWSEYALIRRVHSLLEAVFALGLGLALVRQVSLTDGSDGRLAVSHFVAAVCVSAVVVLPFVAIGNLFPIQTARLIFGDGDLHHLVLPLSVLVVAGALNGHVYTYLIGKMYMQRAYLLMICNFCAVPLCVFLLFDQSVSRLYIAQGLIIFTIALSAAIVIYGRAPPAPRAIPVLAWSLLRDGARRVPGDVGLNVIFASPAIWAAHSMGTHQAGSVAFGMTLLTLAGMAISPFGAVLLPQATRALKSNDMGALRAKLRALLVLCLIMGVPGIVLGELLLPSIIAAYLGESFVDIVPTLRLMLVGALPYLFYCAFRGAVDAVTFRPVNARNIWIAIVAGAATFLVTRGFMVDLYALASALNSALFVLAGLTLYEIGRIVTGRRLLEQE